MAEARDVKLEETKEVVEDAQPQNTGSEKPEEAIEPAKDDPLLNKDEKDVEPLKLKPPGDDYVPKPFKTIRNVIIVSYVCYIFLIFPGAIANQYAWEAKKYKELGSFSEAKAMARSAVCWIYVGFGIGILCAVILAIVLPLTI